MSKALINSLITSVFLILFFGGSAQAQLQTKVPQETLRPQKSRSIKWSIRGQSISRLSVQTEYFRSQQVPGQALEVGLGSVGQVNSGSFTLHWQGEVFTNTSEQQPYIDLKESYLERKYEAFSLSLGRRLWNWSYGENQWGRGLWQPQLTYNKLEPSTQGLFGAFVHLPKMAKRWSFLAWFSPLHIPTMGPSVKEVDGQFTSANPWFNPPTESVNFAGKETEIDYSLKNLRNQDVLFNPGLALQISHHQKNHQVKLSYAYKPMPQLLLGAPFKVNAESFEVPKLEVDVHPRVAYHALTSLEYTYGKQALFYASSTLERPLDTNPPPGTWLIQNTAKAWIYELGGVFPLKSSWGLQGEVGGQVIDGGDQPVDHPQIKGGYLFERRFRYQEALKLGVSLDRRWLWGRPFEMGSELIFDQGQNGAAAIFSATTEWQKNMHVSIRGEWLGILDNKKPDVHSGFLREYRSNDSLYAQVKYVF